MGLGGMRSLKPIDQWTAHVLGSWLREWRLRTGASQRTVAHLAGINQGGLSRIERGIGRPSGFRLARLIVTLDWLSGGGSPHGPFADIGESRPSRLPVGLEPRPPAVVGRRSIDDRWEPFVPPPDEEGERQRGLR